MTIWRMRVACWIRKATRTRSEYVIPIAFLRERWLRGHASLLRYIYIDYMASDREFGGWGGGKLTVSRTTGLQPYHLMRYALREENLHPWRLVVRLVF